MAATKPYSDVTTVAPSGGKVVYNDGRVDSGGGLGGGDESLFAAVTDVALSMLLNVSTEDLDGNYTNVTSLGNGTPSHCDIVLKDTAASEPAPEYSHGVTLAISLVLLMVPIVTIFGNGVTILAVLTHRKLRTKTNAFIVSLAIADMCVSLLVMPFGIYQQMNHKVWELGDVVCRLASSFDVMMCTVSIFHLSSLAIDRYLAICRPFLHERMTVRMIVGMLVFCWVVPVFISFLPIMNGWNKIGIEDFLSCAFPPEAKVCSFVVNIPFSIVASLIAFYIPVAFMGVCNLKIYKAASHQAKQIRSLETAGGHHHNHQNHYKRKSKFHHEAKAAKTLGIIMGCFSVCWFPFFIINIIDPIVGYRIPYEPWMIALWLGYINSMMNPMLYYFFNRNFKAAYRRLLKLKVCKGVRDYEEDIITGNTNVSE